MKQPYIGNVPALTKSQVQKLIATPYPPREDVRKIWFLSYFLLLELREIRNTPADKYKLDEYAERAIFGASPPPAQLLDVPRNPGSFTYHLNAWAKLAGLDDAVRINFTSARFSGALHLLESKSLAPETVQTYIKRLFRQRKT